MKPRNQIFIESIEILIKELLLIVDVNAININQVNSIILLPPQKSVEFVVDLMIIISATHTQN